MTVDTDIDVAGNRLRLIEGGPDRLQALLTLIAGAKSNLSVSYYIFAADDAGHRVRDALVTACRKGVAMTVMVDAFGSSATPDEFFAPLMAAGARFARFGSRLSTRYLIRNHQKMVIADGGHALIGGFNVEDGYFAAHDDASGWCDLGLMVQGPAAAVLQRWFDALAAWLFEGDQRFGGLRRLVRRWHADEGPARWLMGGPTRRLSGWARCVKADLVAANRLDMIAAYFSPGPGMLRRITQIARRGKARVILPLYSDNRMTVGAARHLYARMIRNRVALYEYAPCKLHMKLIVIDDIVYVGSANFDKRSLFINVEVMLRVEDAAFAAAARQLMTRRREQSRPIDRAAYRAMAGPVAVLRWLVSFWIVGVMDYTVTRHLNFRNEPQ